METFSPIGSYSIEIAGRLMISRQAGPFNLAFAQDYAIQSGRVTRELNSTGHYGVLTIFRQSMIFSPDAIDYIMARASLDDGLRRNCIVQAIVAGPKVHGTRSMKPLIERFFERRGLDPGKGRFFSEEIEARTWVDEVLSHADPTKVY